MSSLMTSRGLTNCISLGKLANPEVHVLVLLTSMAADLLTRSVVVMATAV